jgi:hypothetical protein
VTEQKDDPNAELPKELEDRIENAKTLRSFVAAVWQAFDYSLQQQTEEEYDVERQRKLEIDRNSAAAVAGIAFLCILTIITLDTRSIYSQISFYTLCFVTPMLVARALLMEHYLRVDKPPRSTLGALLLSIVEWLGLGFGILSLVAHYSIPGAITMIVAGGLGCWSLIGAPVSEKKASREERGQG